MRKAEPFSPRHRVASLQPPDRCQPARTLHQAACPFAEFRLHTPGFGRPAIRWQGNGRTSIHWLASGDAACTASTIDDGTAALRHVH